MIKPEILILDEAMNAVDGISEVTIMYLLQDRSRERTTIVISHRQSTLSCCEEGIVLEKGVRYAVSVELVGALDGETMRVTRPSGFTAGDAPPNGLKAIFTVFAPLRRVLSANWFVPVARVGAGGFELQLLT